MYERAREHEADRQKTSEDSHQIKHWLSDHQDLLTTPKFRFRIIQTFQDPLSRQLAEAVRIDLRGENVLNSRSEYSRCKVPRLTVDQEGWTSSKKKVVVAQEIAKNQINPQPVDEDAIKEAKYSLGDRDMKRKSTDSPSIRKNKRRKLERLTGWGESSIQQEDIPSTQEGLSSRQEELPTQQDELTSLQEAIQPQRWGACSKDNITEHIKTQDNP